jgi:hypothetical protein
VCVFSPIIRRSRNGSQSCSTPKLREASKKKAIVAVGRRLAIDLWRINTGKSTAAKLGLK